MAGITSIASLSWPGEIAPPKLKPHSRRRVRFVVFNPTIVVFPLLEIAKLSTQAYWANIVVSTDLDRKRKLFSFTSATMAPRKIIIDTDPVYCPFPVAFDKRSEPTDTFGRGSMTFWRYCWHSQHRQRSFKCCSFPWHTATLISKIAYATSSHCSTMWTRRLRGEKALDGVWDLKLFEVRSL
jgi:hypothetical protein